MEGPCADRLFGRFTTALRGDTDDTPLQVKLNNLVELIAKIGSLAGLILFSVLMIKFFVQLGTSNPPRCVLFLSEQGVITDVPLFCRTPQQNALAFVNNLIISVTLIVAAVPEGPCGCS